MLKMLSISTSFHVECPLPLNTKALYVPSRSLWYDEEAKKEAVSILAKMPTTGTTGPAVEYIYKAAKEGKVYIQFASEIVEKNQKENAVRMGRLELFGVQDGKSVV